MFSVFSVRSVAIHPDESRNVHWNASNFPSPGRRRL